MFVSISIYMYLSAMSSLMSSRGLGGIERVDQAFKTAEDSPELMQEHCEKEHPSDCEVLMNMSEEELFEVVSMISEC